MGSVDPLQIVAEEEALLERVQQALEAARRRRSQVAGAPAIETLESLREEAAAAREEDAPPCCMNWRCSSGWSRPGLRLGCLQGGKDR